MANNLHTIKDPLILSYKGGDYKVNKPNQGTQELVSKSYAEELRAALALLIDNGYQIPSNKDMDVAIRVYNQSQE